MVRLQDLRNMLDHNSFLRKFGTRFVLFLCYFGKLLAREFHFTEKRKKINQRKRDRNFLRLRISSQYKMAELWDPWQRRQNSPLHG